MRTVPLLAAAGIVTAINVPPQARAITKTLPAGWSYVGCKVDVGNRILGAPTGLAWLDAFLAACTGCKYDYIAVHWYGGWIDDFTEFIDGAKKYGKPIWLTEFGLAWDSDAQASNYEEFLPLALSYLDSEPAVAKYAFFGAFHCGTGKDMIAADGTLTNLGKMYVS